MLSEPMKAVFVVLCLWLFGLHAAQAERTIYLVRHAEKMDKGDSRDPALSPQGLARAEALARILKDAGITAIYATEFRRSRQTANPLARALKLEMTVLPSNGTGVLVSRIKEKRGNALVVGHSNTIPEIVRAFGVSTPLTIAENDYDNIFALRLRPNGPELQRLYYPPWD